MACELEEVDWSDLPEDVVVHILSFLPIADRYHTAAVCGAWRRAFHCPYVWNHFRIQFTKPSDIKYLECVSQFGHQMRHVSISIEQGVVQNRTNALKILEFLATCTHRRLASLTVKFSGENPLFYAGYEFATSLAGVFRAPERGGTVSQITSVDLSELSVAYANELIDVLSEYNPMLQSLNVQNSTLVCQITQSCILRLVQRCRQLTDIRLFYCLLTDDLLLSFTEANRKPLGLLSIRCRREEKYGRDVTNESWTALSKTLPELRVILGFDHTCPLFKVSEILRPKIPVCVLLFETYTRISDEVNLATEYYYQTLETVVVHSPSTRDLHEALENMAKTCKRLRCCLVYCVLPTDVIDRIHQARPELKASGQFILKDTRDPENLWVVGQESGD